jgi:hypothetical protein
VADDDRTQLASRFFRAACELAWHTGSLQERLADAYADHLLAVVGQDLPSELQPVFREIEEQLNRADADDDDADDPFQAAAERLDDGQARALIERILLLYGQLVLRAAS